MFTPVKLESAASLPAAARSDALPPAERPPEAKATVTEDEKTGVVVRISHAAREAMKKAAGIEDPRDADGVRGLKEEADEDSEDLGRKLQGEADDDLTAEEQAEVARLRARDAQVRAQGRAQLAAAEGRASVPVYRFQVGPDGHTYAVDGDVDIDTTAREDPETLLKQARQLRAAATAHANPGGRDRAVESAATQMEMRAMADLAEQRREQLTASTESAPGQAPGDAALTATILGLTG